MLARTFAGRSMQTTVIITAFLFSELIVNFIVVRLFCLDDDDVDAAAIAAVEKSAPAIMTMMNCGCKCINGAHKKRVNVPTCNLRRSLD